MKINKSNMGLASVIGAIAIMSIGADFDCSDSKPPVSSSGVNKATVKVPVGPDGHTTEQRNIIDRLKNDNEPGSIKHLYVISALTGDVLIYSTVRGKVTSGGKRLTPTTVTSGATTNGIYGGLDVDIGGYTRTTNEVLQDDGTYGSSDSYLYWFDTKGIYHQQYASGCIIHIADQPLAVKHVVLNMELDKSEQQSDPIPAPVKGSKK